MKKVYKLIAISILATVLAFHVGGSIAGSQMLTADPIIGDID